MGTHVTLAVVLAAVAQLSAGAQQGKPTLYLVGDSTVNVGTERAGRLG